MPLIKYLTGHAAWSSSLRYRDFRLVWVSTLFQSVTTGMEQLAMGWLVLEMTDSPFMVGLSFAARSAPSFFIGIPAGAIADRVDRRVFLRYVILGGSLTTGLIAILLLLEQAQVWHIMALVLAGGCLNTFIHTVRQAYIYDIVGRSHALNGLALTGISQRAGSIFGAIVAGVLIATIGAGAQYLVISAAYIAASATLLATHHSGQAAPAIHGSVLSNLQGYLHFIQRNHTLMGLMFLTATMSVFGFTHRTLLPIFAKDVLELGAAGLGVMNALAQGGGMLGILLLVGLGDFKHKGMMMLITSICSGLGLMGLSVVTGLPFFLSLLILVNGCNWVADTIYKTLMQTSVPNEQRGRGAGSYVLSAGMDPAGHLGIGGMASILGAPGAILITGGILTFASVASAMTMPRIRRLT